MTWLLGLPSRSWAGVRRKHRAAQLPFHEGSAGSLPGIRGWELTAPNLALSGSSFLASGDWRWEVWRRVLKSPEEKELQPSTPL